MRELTPLHTPRSMKTRHQHVALTAMKIAQRIATVAFILALPVFLVTTNVRVAAGEARLYERGFREYNAAEMTGVPLRELDRAAAEMIAYFENDARMLRIVVDRGGEEISLFNQKETDHMRDVKSIMRLLFRVHEVTLALVLAYVAGRFLWAGESRARTLAKESLAGIGVGILVVGAIGAFALTGFDAAWTTFHEILFRNDLWRLNPDTDRLIQMFPEAFWQETTYLIAAVTLAQAAMIVLACVAFLAFGRGNGRQDGGGRDEGVVELEPVYED